MAMENTKMDKNKLESEAESLKLSAIVATNTYLDHVKQFINGLVDIANIDNSISIDMSDDWTKCSSYSNEILSLDNYSSITLTVIDNNCNCNRCKFNFYISKGKSNRYNCIINIDNMNNFTMELDAASKFSMACFGLMSVLYNKINEINELINDDICMSCKNDISAYFEAKAKLTMLNKRMSKKLLSKHGLQVGTKLKYSSNIFSDFTFTIQRISKKYIRIDNTIDRFPFDNKKSMRIDNVIHLIEDGSIEILSVE